MFIYLILIWEMNEINNKMMNLKKKKSYCVWFLLLIYDYIYFFILYMFVCKECGCYFCYNVVIYIVYWKVKWGWVLLWC